MVTEMLWPPEGAWEGEGEQWDPHEGEPHLPVPFPSPSRIAGQWKRQEDLAQVLLLSARVP